MQTTITFNTKQIKDSQELIQLLNKCANLLKQYPNSAFSTNIEDKQGKTIARLKVK